MKSLSKIALGGALVFGLLGCEKNLEDIASNSESPIKFYNSKNTEEIYGDWVYVPENLNMQYQNMLISFKKNSKKTVDVQIKEERQDFQLSGYIADKDIKTYTSVLKQENYAYKILNHDIPPNATNHISITDEEIGISFSTPTNIDNYIKVIKERVSISENCKFQKPKDYPDAIPKEYILKDHEKEIIVKENKFYNNWWDKSILLNKFASKNDEDIRKDIKSIDALDIKIMGPNSLIMAFSSKETDGTWETGDLHFVTRDNAFQRNSTLKEIHGKWVDIYSKNSPGNNEYSDFIELAPNTMFRRGWEKNSEYYKQEFGKTFKIDNLYFAQKIDLKEFIIFTEYNKKLISTGFGNHGEIKKILEKNPNAHLSREKILEEERAARDTK